jgi:Mg2+-importing ATPase
MKAAHSVSDRPTSFWSVPTEALFEELNASVRGLTQQEGQERLARYGLNRIKARRRTDSLTLFLAQFNSPIILILLVAAGLSLLLGDG